MPAAMGQIDASLATGTIFRRGYGQEQDQSSGRIQELEFFASLSNRSDLECFFSLLAVAYPTQLIQLFAVLTYATVHLDFLLAKEVVVLAW